MFNYAQLNDNNICIAISILKSKINQNNMIEIDNMDDDYLWRKYENNEWSQEKFLPNYSQIELDRVETIEQAIAELSILLAGGVE
jgi:ribosomal protein S4